MIDISKLDKAQVLAALYNNAVSTFDLSGEKEMTKEEAHLFLKQREQIDYIGSKALRIDLSKDSFDPTGYNRDNGREAAERVINQLLELTK